MDLKTLPLFAFLAPLLLFFQQVRGFLVKFISFFWKSRHIPSDFSDNFYFELSRRSKRIHFDNYNLVTTSMFSLKQKTGLLLLFKQHDFEIMLYKRFIPIVVRGAELGFKIHYFKFTFPFERFMANVLQLTHVEMAERNVRRNKDRFRVEMIQGRSLKSIAAAREETYNNQSTPGREPSPRAFMPILYPHTIFNKGVANHIIGVNPSDFAWNHPMDATDKYQLTDTGKRILQQCEKWIRGERWHKERNVAWRRGFLLHGKPGNGKSLLVLEIAKRLGIPLFIFDLSSMDNTELQQKLQYLTSDSAIILFEDFDVVFNKRENLCKSSQYGGVTFDFFLNRLSGANSITNKLIFITTNHLDKIDDALLRPGRLDSIIEIMPLNAGERRNLAKVMLGDNPDLIEQVMSTGEGDTTAEFENRCTTLALSTFWETPE